MTTKTSDGYPRCLVLLFHDWEALYLDGELVAEALRLTIADLVDACWKTDLKIRDIHYHLANEKMHKVIDYRRHHKTYCPEKLTEYGEENLNHVRV